MNKQPMIVKKHECDMTRDGWGEIWYYIPSRLVRRQEDKPRWYYLAGDGDVVPINYCPFCGEKLPEIVTG